MASVHRQHISMNQGLTKRFELHFPIVVVSLSEVWFMYQSSASLFHLILSLILFPIPLSFNDFFDGIILASRDGLEVASEKQQNIVYVETQREWLQGWLFERFILHEIDDPKPDINAHLNQITSSAAARLSEATTIGSVLRTFAF